jgi:hypothetical protein
MPRPRPELERNVAEVDHGAHGAGCRAHGRELGRKVRDDVCRRQVWRPRRRARTLLVRSSAANRAAAIAASPRFRAVEAPSSTATPPPVNATAIAGVTDRAFARTAYVSRVAEAAERLVQGPRQSNASAARGGPGRSSTAPIARTALRRGETSTCAAPQQTDSDLGRSARQSPRDRKGCRPPQRDASARPPDLWIRVLRRSTSDSNAMPLRPQ